MNTSNKPRSWDSIADAIRAKVSESGLAFIELERRTDGEVKRQTLMNLLAGTQDGLRTSKADVLFKLFGLRVVEVPSKTRRASTAGKGKARGRAKAATKKGR